MATELNHTTISISYVELLQNAGIPISSMDQLHLAVGSFPTRVDWVLHLAVSLPYIPTMLMRMIPFIKSMQLYVTMPKDQAAAMQILGGELGEDYLGKIITCYASDGIAAAALYNKLLHLSYGIAGATVITAMPLGGILYTQYVGKETFKKNMWPYPIPIPVPKAEKLLLLNRYKILKPVDNHIRGYVFTGIYTKGFLSLGRCIIKQGRDDLRADQGKRSMADRLVWQAKVLRDLQGIVPVPQVLDTCRHGESMYLIMQRIKGKRFGDFLHTWYQNKTWPEQSKDRQRKIVAWLLDIAGHIYKIHDQGYVHRDITPNNFILHRNGTIYLIDFEMSYNYKDGYPLVPFSGGTYGFMPPEQARGEQPAEKEDSWAFGGMMIVFFTGKPPQTFRYRDPETLAEDLKEVIQEPELISLIKSCYQHDPQSRPSIREITKVLQTLKIS